MYILGIESSCDETAAAIVEDGKHLISNVISTSVKEQALYGGVVPEIASRRHAEYISATVQQALQDANMTIVDVDEAINLKVGNLADFDLDAATVSASNTSIDADAKAGESLGTSTTDLVSAARNNQAVGNTESNTQSTTQSSTTTNTSNDSQSAESAPQQDNTPQQDTADQSSADDTASDDSGEDIPWAD